MGMYQSLQGWKCRSRLQHHNSLQYKQRTSQPSNYHTLTYPISCLTTPKPHYSQPHRHIHLIHLFSIRIYHDSNKPLHSRSRPDKPLSVSHIITTSLLTCSNGGWGLPRQKFESVQVAFLSIDSFVLSVSWARRGINAPLLRTRSLHLGESPATFPNAHTACKCTPVNPSSQTLYTNSAPRYSREKRTITTLTPWPNKNMHSDISLRYPTHHRNC